MRFQTLLFHLALWGFGFVPAQLQRSPNAPASTRKSNARRLDRFQEGGARLNEKLLENHRLLEEQNSAAGVWGFLTALIESFLRTILEALFPSSPVPPTPTPTSKSATASPPEDPSMLIALCRSDCNYICFAMIVSTHALSKRPSSVSSNVLAVQYARTSSVEPSTWPSLNPSSVPPSLR